ncbi:hypothetical protein DFS34DRAFT_668665 [Phlyctochytrium arcticum]|nr:hypothetical protein DFS34DRAFT_668665 [Phlyctochytrium arcticum]
MKLSQQADISGLIIDQIKKSKDFDPVIGRTIKPEKNLNFRNQFGLFYLPVYIWTPQNAFKKKEIPCALSSNCKPKVKGYHDITVEEHDYHAQIIFTSYTCRIYGESWNWTSQQVPLHPLPQTWVFGISLNDIHHAIMSPKGAAPFVRSLWARRMKRYTLLSIEHACDPKYSQTPLKQRPRACTIEEYAKDHEPVDDSTFINTWMQVTSPIVEIAKVVMRKSVTYEAISFDATQKFPAKLKAQEKNTYAKVTPQQLKLLNIVQNEIGQIMDISFMASESHETIAAALGRVRKDMADAGHAPSGAYIPRNSMAYYLTEHAVNS